MPINSRNKGAQFERDVAKILNQFFQDQGIDYQTKRNLDQYQQKDLCDLDIPFHAVECKSYKEGSWLKAAWWDQVCSASNGKIPTLIFKFNRVPIRVCIPLYAINTEWDPDPQKICVISIEHWLEILAENWDKYRILEEKNYDKKTGS